MAKKIAEQDIGRIRELLGQTVGTADYAELERLGGLTNHTYHASLADGREYVVRIPGEGTEELISRKNERASTELAAALGIDAKCLYFGDDGAKVTEYIPGAVTLSAAGMRERAPIRQAAEILKKLHGCGKDTGVPFEVFDMAAGYERIIKENQVPMPDDYPEIKEKVMRIKELTDASGDTRRVPCHNDPLCENWVLGKDRMYLIDWEYAGMNDGMWDLADVSIEAGFDPARDEQLLEDYFGRAADDRIRRHFLASKVYVDYLWTLWAKTRVPFDGQPMEDWAAERYARLQGNIRAFAEAGK